MLLLNLISLAFTGSTKKKISLFLHNDMWELEVLIKVNATAKQSNMNKYLYDDIKLYIIYGTHLEQMQCKYCPKYCLQRAQSL